MLSDQRRVHAQRLAANGEGVAVARQAFFPPFALRRMGHPSTLTSGQLLGWGRVVGRADGVQFQRSRRLTDRLVCLRMLRQRDQRSLRTQDASLLPRNFGNRVAQVVLVVQRDVRNDRDQRIDDVGGVQPAAQTNLKHGDIDLLLRIVEKRQRRQRLEEAGVMGQSTRDHKLFRG